MLRQPVLRCSGLDLHGGQRRHADFDSGDTGRNQPRRGAGGGDVERRRGDLHGVSGRKFRCYGGARGARDVLRFGGAEPHIRERSMHHDFGAVSRGVRIRNHAGHDGCAVPQRDGAAGGEDGHGGGGVCGWGAVFPGDLRRSRKVIIHCLAKVTHHAMARALLPLGKSQVSPVAQHSRLADQLCPRMPQTEHVTRLRHS
jgi:hypothetical protein